MSKISTKQEDEKSSAWSVPKKTLQDEYKDANDQTKIQQLSEMYNISLQVASCAYSSVGYDEAVEQLASEEKRIFYAEMAGNINNNNDNDNDNDKSPSTAKKEKEGFSSIFGNSSKRAMQIIMMRKINQTSKLPDFKSMVRTHSGGESSISFGRAFFP